MKRLLLAFLFLLCARSALAAQSELLTISNTPIGITANLCQGISGGVMIEVVTNTINYLLHDAAATPDATSHSLAAGGVLTLAEPSKFRAVRSGGSDATARVSCTIGVQETRVLKPASISASITGADGALLDGVDSGIKATVKDYANSNPLATVLVDTNGDQVSVGGGTQYTQGVAATDTDVLTMAGCVRADTAAVATGVADGDRARCIVDASGRMWVNVGTSALPTGAATSAKQDTGNTSLSSIDGKITAVNTGAVVVSSSALPSGASTAAKQPALGTAGSSSTDVISVQGIASGTALPVSAASLPLPALAATSTKQSDGSQKTQVVDGSGNVIGATSNALDINIKSGNPTTITATQATGTNLHTVVDSGTVTTVTTVTNLTGGTTAHDGAAGSINPILTGCYASAAVPSDVSADNDATRIWCLRSGALAAQPTFGGVLQSTGNGTAGTGTPRVTIASDNTAFSVNATGTLADNGAASGTNRMGTLPAIGQANLPSAATAGRNTALLTDLNRVLVTGQMPVNMATYSANKLGLAPAASATDIARMPGNATNTVILTKVTVSCTQTTAGIVDVQLIKRSTAGSGGTSASTTITPHDSGNAAASSVPVTYTANPTVGTLVGNIDSVKLACLAPATATPADVYIWKAGMGQSVVLRGTGENLAVNLNGVTVTGGSFNITYDWIETTGL